MLGLAVGTQNYTLFTFYSLRKLPMNKLYRLCNNSAMKIVAKTELRTSILHPKSLCTVSGKINNKSE